MAADGFAKDAIAFAGNSSAPITAPFQTCPADPHVAIAAGDPGSTLVGMSCAADIAYFGSLQPAASPGFTLDQLPSPVTDVAPIAQTPQGPLLFQLDNTSGGTIANEVHFGWMSGDGFWEDHFAWTPRGERSVYLIASALSHAGKPLAIVGVVPAGVTTAVSPTQVFLLR